MEASQPHAPDKDDIEHAYAAQYTITAAGPYQNHKVLFFGGDRLANNGNTNIGFWFFHNNVTAGGSRSGTDANGNPTCSFNSGCGFTQLHTVGNKSLGGNTPGDLFILSAFTNGGAQPTIKIFEWVGPGNATPNYLGSNNCFTSACTLQPLPVPNTPGFNDNRCDVGSPTTRRRRLCDRQRKFEAVPVGLHGQDLRRAGEHVRPQRVLRGRSGPHRARVR